MKEQVVQTIAETFFRYHSGRYATLPQLDLLKQDIREIGHFGAIGVTVTVGRDLDLFFYSRDTFHGMIERMRKPAISDPDKEELFEETLKKILMSVMLQFKCTAGDFTVKRFTGFSGARWDFVKEDELAQAIAEGLRARHATFVLSMDAFSIFTGYKGANGWVFRPPRYFGNVIRFPDIVENW